MWRNYLTVGLRALAKNKVYAFINIFGLAIGIAACLMILLYVRYESSYDDWLPDNDRVFQFQSYYQSLTSSDKFDNQGVPYVTKGALLKDFPQIEAATYVGGGVGITVLKDGQAYTPEDGQLVDSRFLDVVALPMLHGNDRALVSPGSAILSEKQAIRFFGTTNAVGRTLTTIIMGVKADYRVTGVFKDLPKNTHMAFGMLLRADMPSLYAQGHNEAFLESWGWTAGWVYVKLKPGVDVATVNSQFDAWKKRNIPDSTTNGQRSNEGDGRTYALVNVRDVHLGKAQNSDMTPGNDRTSIATFSVIAVLILAMACMNFTNLATARAGQRAREVALRKVLGATRKQLIMQFLGESILLTAIATLVALALAEIAVPWFAHFLDADIALHYFGHGGLLLPILALVLLVGAAGGLYPGLYLSRFQPARVLKANKSASEAEGSGRLRGILVVVQFAVSIGLMACTAIVYGQTLYARSVDPGFKRDGLLQVNGIGATSLQGREEALIQQIRKVPGVTAAARTGIGVNTGNTSSTVVGVPGQPEPVQIGIYAIDADYFPTMQIRTVTGRIFDRNRPADDATEPAVPDPEAARAMGARGANIVLNESGVRRLGYTSPQDAVGKIIDYDRGDEGGIMKLTIIGVVADSRFRSVRTPIEPIMFFVNTNNTYWLDVRYDGNPAEVRAGVERVWRSFAPDVPFKAEFSDAIMARTYQRIDARAQMFGMFALLAVVIGCLGLFGLAAFTAERRTKEIGIRKVLGAGTFDIVRLLVWQFTRPVVIANLIAWWAMRDWLNQFDARMPLGPTPFLLAGLLALLIAVVTIAAHAVRVARTNPIKALRYE
ncbi:putative ABC transporter permease protein [Sphingobium sp. SYK-6]|uniref:ABC transporter permease n=1 Tax=Sphingobium sp. (strain NBRC 103272 / SYK-6) TaxID=627192 RepID=UPI0002277006|nr:ABC transporter permease [Sphingobium sp. SYK-6]BAK67386.1 putative ABC transporter permease protein [Sphingobium sp. SYK-6]